MKSQTFSFLIEYEEGDVVTVNLHPGWSNVSAVRVEGKPALLSPDGFTARARLMPPDNKKANATVDVEFTGEPVHILDVDWAVSSHEHADDIDPPQNAPHAALRQEDIERHFKISSRVLKSGKRLDRRADNLGRLAQYFFEVDKLHLKVLMADRSPEYVSDRIDKVELVQEQLELRLDRRHSKLIDPDLLYTVPGLSDAIVAASYDLALDQQRLVGDWFCHPSGDGVDWDLVAAGYQCFAVGGISSDEPLKARWPAQPDSHFAFRFLEFAFFIDDIQVEIEKHQGAKEGVDKVDFAFWRRAARAFSAVGPLFTLAYGPRSNACDAGGTCGLWEHRGPPAKQRSEKFEGEVRRILDVIAEKRDCELRRLHAEAIRDAKTTV